MADVPADVANMDDVPADVAGVALKRFPRKFQGSNNNNVTPIGAAAKALREVPGFSLATEEDWVALASVRAFFF